MRKFLENYRLTLAGLVVTFILYILANFGLHLSNSDQYLVFAIGVMTTLVIATFEHEVPKLFATQIDQKIKLLE
jgi:drug/metabolite transporter (DMT)-like permease